MKTKNKQYAKCSFDNCKNIAKWTIGSWQCCDKCADKWIIKDFNNPNSGISRWGTSNRIGQKIILEHNLKFNLNHNIL